MAWVMCFMMFCFVAVSLISLIVPVGGGQMAKEIIFVR